MHLSVCLGLVYELAFYFLVSFKNNLFNFLLKINKKVLKIKVLKSCTKGAKKKKKASLIIFLILNQSLTSAIHEKAIKNFPNIKKKKKKKINTMV